MFDPRRHQTLVVDRPLVGGFDRPTRLDASAAALPNTFRSDASSRVACCPLPREVMCYMATTSTVGHGWGMDGA